MDIYCIDMPKHAIDYQKAKIYKICCKDVNITDCYVGSSTNINRRKSEHKCRCEKEGDAKYNYNVYQFIRDHGGWDNWAMIVVEDFACDNKHELETRERFHIEDLHATLNKQVPTRTLKEWYGKNAEHIKEYQKEYQKQYQKDNVEHCKLYR